MSDTASAVLIVLIVFSFVSFNVWLKHRSTLLKAGGKTQDLLAAENQALRAKTDALEQRVQVLESIVTDKKFQLGEEISSLAR